MAKKVVRLKRPAKVLKLDIGCGKNKQEGFTGVDSIKFPGVDVVMDIRKRWPWKDDSVDEVYCSHVLEHLTNLDEKWERVHFFNELYRVLKPGGTCKLILPHWCSNRYYGDPTHKEPFSEMGFEYLSREWRGTQAPHTDAEYAPGMYTCDFQHVTYGYSLAPWLASRNEQFRSDALNMYKEAAQDMIATLTKPDPKAKK
jgi:SAM-dependent methyltransferase